MPLLSQVNRKKAIFSIVVTNIIGWAFTYAAIEVFAEYAFGLFVWLPLVMGIIVTLLYVENTYSQKSAVRAVVFGNLLMYCLGMLLFGWEGVICLIMAAPLGVLFTWFGYLLGYRLAKYLRRGYVPTIIALVTSIPALMGFETISSDGNNLQTVTTRIHINAPISVVWKNVVAFPQLPSPTELIFKAGIAYPTDAKITGEGVGAIRHCNFSTGSFVEPITTWNEPFLLQFDVEEQPVPMKELSPYEIEPNHLHGYWVSKKGQFKLTPLNESETLLEGTTWYYNRILPDVYWSLWSNFIVHKIHDRVLKHIKHISEKA